MNIEKRAQEIKESIKSCSKNEYLKSERLPEMLELQRELVALAFDAESADTEDLRLWDVENYFARLSVERNDVALAELLQFKEHCKEVTCLIAAEISGKKGEEKTFSYIDKIQEPHILLKNVAFNRDGVRTEIDAVVITRKGAFIVEVKNTKMNVFIDENGDYYRVGEFSKWDCNIEEKLQTRENLLRDTLEENGFFGVNIYPMVVFTNNRATIKNCNNEIATCFLTQLPYSIAEHKGEDCFTEEDFSLVADAINKARSVEVFQLSFDADQLKHSFADLMAKLEDAAELPKPIEEKITEVTIETTNNDSPEVAAEAPNNESLEIVTEQESKKARWLGIFEKAIHSGKMRAAGSVAVIVATLVAMASSIKSNY